MLEIGFKLGVIDAVGSVVLWLFVVVQDLYDLREFGFLRGR